MDVSIVGGGYVGLVSGACLADHGHRITIVERDQEKVSKINQGLSPFYEPGLNELLSKYSGNRLVASCDLLAAVNETQATMIAVGTPSDDDGSVDLSAIESASREIGRAIASKDEAHVVLVKSTVPPGTTDDVVGKAIESTSGKLRGVDFGLGMNPEFLTEGTAVDDFQSPDRIVFGHSDEAALEAQRELYRAFSNADTIEVGNSTAEMIKYMSNALLATMISFANEFADLCVAIRGVDSADVQRGVHLSRYLTHGNPAQTAPIASFIEAGCGFGGSCLPKDVKGLIDFGSNIGVDMPMLRSVVKINSQRASRMIDLLANDGELVGKKVAVLGLSFRPDTNDLRESPAIPIINRLRELQASIRAYDPQAMGEARESGLFGDIHYASSLRECVEGVDAVAIVTRWSDFGALPTVLADIGEDPLIVDGRRMLLPTSVSKYRGIGRNQSL